MRITFGKEVVPGLRRYVLMVYRDNEHSFRDRVLYRWRGYCGKRYILVIFNVCIDFIDWGK